MPRTARIVVEGLPHHVTQRGNYGQLVFSEYKDYSFYLFLVKKYAKKYNLDLLGYCLMPNHVHFISIPKDKDSLAMTFQTVHMCYSQFINRKRNLRGHLWQGRFYSCVLNQTHLITALRYIEKNPVRANIVKKSWEWKWSSALVHVGEKGFPIKMRDVFELLDMNPNSWKNYIDSQEDEVLIELIRKNTYTGKPL